ncbi:thymidylate synthase [Actinomadura latina]|uniref:Thymidylate synthase/dCMP hydroxymethylase domain-containing protein n=1 Tax=Actinomadura latina TaxID=163603 RepID=A0A846Z0P0_9ACTN|nr:thymidylate synthase [Actinomadura latina]NKZ04345.1 hypothetical protein [Actinomadura latina]
MEITIETIESGWNAVVDLFRDDAPVRIATRNGVSFDIPGLTININNVTNTALPTLYKYPELAKDYLDRLLGSMRGESMLYHRLYRWEAGEKPEFNQIAEIKEVLANDRNSRSAVFTAWRPEEDLGSLYPISPVDGCFRIIENVLHVFLTARSTDVMVGLVPELIAWAHFVADMTLGLSVEKGVIHYHCWSLHMYEIDFVSSLG